MSFADRPDHFGVHLSGFLIAVAGTSFLNAIAWTLIIGYTRAGESEPAGVLSFFAIVFFVSLVFVASSFVAVGLPFTILCAVAKAESAIAYAAGGFMAGTAVVFLISPNGNWESLPFMCFVAGLPGAGCAWLWWHFGRRKMQSTGVDLG